MRLSPLNRWLLVASLSVPGAHGLAADATVPATLTKIKELRDPMKSLVRQFVPVHLEGAVYGVDVTDHSLALKDDTGMIWLEATSLPEGVHPGVTVSVEGVVAAGNGHAYLGKEILLEGESFKDLAELSGKLYLAPGKHEFELDFYQGTGRSLLEVDWEGPGVKRGRIPGSALWHPDPVSQDRWLPGMQYQIYQGLRTRFPDFAALVPYTNGITDNFSARLSQKGNNFTIRFRGSVETREPGIYQFNIRADDTARMKIAFDTTSRINLTGSARLAMSRRVRPGQEWGEWTEPAWIRTEGIVRQVGTDNGHIQLELAAETGRTQVTVAEGDAAAPAMLLNSTIRVVGLGWGAATAFGTKIAGTMLVPGMSQVSVLQASEGNWRAHPVCSISNLMKHRADETEHTPVHVRGTISEAESGKMLVLDETGQIEVRTSLARQEDVGAKVELLGILRSEGTNTSLLWAVHRPVFAPEDSGADRSNFTTVEAIRRLTPAEAAASRPVRFRGITTFVLSGGLRAHVQGENEALHVACTETNWQALQPGQLCEFEGYTTSTRVFPSVIYQRFTVLGPGQFPEPLQPTLAQLLNGSLESAWVEIQGGVINVRGPQLTVALQGGEVLVQVSRCDGADLTHLLHALVRVRGAVSLAVNKKRQVTSVNLNVNSLVDITIESPPPANGFAVASRPISDLLQFNPDAPSVHFVKVAGQIIHTRGENFYLMEETNGLRFTTADKVRLSAGDKVEVVGIPERESGLTILRQAFVRVTGHSPLPQPKRISPGDLTVNSYDSTLVELTAKVLNVATNPLDQVIELQAGTHIFLARLDRRQGLLPEIDRESQVKVSGAYASQGAVGALRTSVSSAEILLNSPAGIAVLKRPPWWNLRNSLLAVGAMALGLAGAFTWITALRRRVEIRTRELRKEIAQHHRTEASLNQQTGLLQAEIEERKRAQVELEQIHRQLVDASRQAGQAEVAASVLHNVGNVLNSVNVSTSVITERVRSLRLANLAKAAELLQSNSEDLGRFLTTDEKGRRLPQYLGQLAHHLGAEQAELLTELNGLGQNVEHIKEIVAMQQAYAKRFGVAEQTLPSDLVESALKLQAATYLRHSIEVVRRYGTTPPLLIDKHKVLQILVNLFQNAKYACDEGPNRHKTITVGILLSNDREVNIEVADNGIGIPPENMTRIFAHGFTTRKNGHGFGLHSAALAAREMGGTLTARSDGLGKGAAFTLTLPLEAQGEAGSQNDPGLDTDEVSRPGAD